MKSNKPQNQKEMSKSYEEQYVSASSIFEVNKNEKTEKKKNATVKREVYHETYY